MNVQLETVSYSEKSILRNLLELYEYEATEFNGRDLDEHGSYGYRYLDHYWTEDGRYAYFIRIDDALAGFALIRTLEMQSSAPVYSMAEFFVVHKYRRNGVGSAAAAQLFDLWPGRWSVTQESANLNAQAFWRTTINQYTQGAFQESQTDMGPRLLFDSSKTKD